MKNNSVFSSSLVFVNIRLLQLRYTKGRSCFTNRVLDLLILLNWRGGSCGWNIRQHIDVQTEKKKPSQTPR